jgi:predicted ATPase with chaperone activity
MKPRSAKNKGKRLQNEICEEILKAFPQLEPDDVKSAIMGESGTDIKLSPAARKLFPFSVECKNQEKLNVWSALEQAQENTTMGTDPLLVFKRNRSTTFVAMELETFFNLLTKPKE